MDKRQKMMQQWYLDEEIKIIQELHKIYSEALKDINRNIKKQMERFDPETGDLPQSAIYQIKYQQMLRGQIEDVLNNLQTSQYLLMSDYLDDCYEDGFVGSVFDMHGQGVPLMMPIDRNAMVQAVTLDSKISKGLYTRLGEDITALKKKITSEVSRSILNGTSYAETARQLAGITRIGYNNAIRITRTEGHRIQVTATMDAMEAAKEQGADVVKQWDSTLDGRTRPSHRRVDGEIRELDESFSNGLKFPGDADGRAAEVINCRCALLERARWAVGGGFTKRNNFTGELETFDTPDDYAKFKKDFFSNENVEYMNYVQQMQNKYGTSNFYEVLERMTDREYKHYTKLLNENPIYSTKGLSVQVDVQKRIADVLGIDVSKVNIGELPVEAQEVIFDAVKQATDKFPQLKGHIQRFNYNADLEAVASSNSLTGGLNFSSEFLDLEALEKVYAYDVKLKFHPNGTDYRAIVMHEIGHQLDGLMTLNGLAGGYIDKFGGVRTSRQIRLDVLKRLGWMDIVSELKQEYRAKGFSGKKYNHALEFELKEFIEKNVSGYACESYGEFFAECFAEYMMSDTPREAAKIFGEILEGLMGELK